MFYDIPTPPAEFAEAVLGATDAVVAGVMN